MQFDMENTLNRSIGATSKTAFDAGGFSYDQVVINLTGGALGVAMASLASPLNVAVGAEVRREGYELFAGEPDSYRNGGVLSAGGARLPGRQVFPGFRPSDEATSHRTASACSPTSKRT
jgi:iron complex outermembrane receptor protein